MVIIFMAVIMSIMVIWTFALIQYHPDKMAYQNQHCLAIEDMVIMDSFIFEGQSKTTESWYIHVSLKYTYMYAI